MQYQNVFRLITSFLLIFLVSIETVSILLFRWNKKSTTLRAAFSSILVFFTSRFNRWIVIKKNCENSYTLLHKTKIKFTRYFTYGGFVVAISQPKKTTTNILLHTVDWAVCNFFLHVSVCVCVCQIVLATFFFVLSSFFFCVLNTHIDTHSHLVFTVKLRYETTKKKKSKIKWVSFLSCYTYKQHTMYTLHEPKRLQSNSRMLHANESEMVNGGPNSTDPMWKKRKKCRRIPKSVPHQKL